MNTLVSIKGTVIKETEKAVFFEFHDISGTVMIAPYEKRWIPLSQVEKRMTGKNEGEDTMMVSEWIMSKVDLI